MTLSGKGIFIWQVAQCEGGNPEQIAGRAEAAGLSHVLIKIADTHWAFGFDRFNHDRLPPVVEALRRRGIQAWGWHYVRGDDPVGEARAAVSRTRALGLDGYVIDAEKEYKQPGKGGAARTFMEHLRAGLPEAPVALSSYRYPRYHPEIPWTEFLVGCDYNMPQVYWEQAHDPELQLERSAGELLALRPGRPVIPTGSAYGVGAWRPTAGDLRRFFEKAQALGCPAANVYSWDWAGRSGNEDLWEAVAGYDWPAPKEPDITESLMEALNASKAGKVAGLYTEDAVHVMADRTLEGREAIRQWYKQLLREDLRDGRFELTASSGEGRWRHFTWTCNSPQGNVLDGNDTLGLVEGKIQYHYSFFTLTP